MGLPAPQDLRFRASPASPSANRAPHDIEQHRARSFSALALVAGCALLTGCREKTEAAPVDAAPVDAAMASASPSFTTTPSTFFEVRNEPVPALEAGVVAYATSVDAGDGYLRFARVDGTISVPQPAGPGWECREKSAKEPAVGQMRMVDCTRRRAGELFFMLAKTYSVDAKPRTAEELSKNEYRADYAKFFQSVKYTSEGPVTYRGRPGYEVTFDAVHAAKGAVRKRERVVTVGTQVFLWSAEGSTDAFVRYRRETEAWMAGATFSELGR